MSGPIVRTGTTPKFWENWDTAFGGGKPSEGAKGAKAAPKAKKADKAKAKSSKKTKK